MYAFVVGEHGEWCKQTCFELATRVPLIISVPGVAGAPSRGKRARAFVELVDLYRTLADVLGLGAVEAGVEGTSFAPLLLTDPSFNHSRYAFSQYPRCAGGADCMMFARTEIEVIDSDIDFQPDL
jgi:iduronate 2-sulfatase